MLLVRRIRHFTPAGAAEPVSFEKGFEPPISSPSAQMLFSNLHQIVEAIPEPERFNCFYTLGQTSGGADRDWLGQTLLPFDVDGVDVKGAGEFDKRYLDIFFEVVRVERKKCAVVFSGNGLHFLIDMAKLVRDRSWFEDHKLPYTTLCEALQAAYEAAGLPAKVDASSFAANRILRLPGTENRKPGRPIRLARVVEGKLTAQKVDLFALAGIPLVREGDQVGERALASFRIDTPAVLSGCGFLKHAEESPGLLSEPEWYAMLSVVGRLEKGAERAHEMSAGHPTYSYQRTEAKLKQAMAASGPRTCANISEMFPGCEECPHFRRITSPVNIRGENFIASEETGFTIIDQKGQFKPQFEDLRKYLDRETGYVTHCKSGISYFYGGSHYAPQSRTELRAYAQDKFEPKPTTATVEEFTDLVGRTNLVQPTFLSSDLDGLVNASNGVLDLKSRILTPHSRERGFLYTLPFGFDPLSTAPKFSAFLNDITCGDEDLGELLLEFIGYALCDRAYWMQKCLILLGEGSNGKTTLLHVIKALIGEGNYSVLGIQELATATERRPLESALANICDEMPPYAIKNTELLKKLMGGETTVRTLYHDATYIKNNAKFIFACNDLPGSLDTSHGFYRRLALVPFNATFTLGDNGKRDYHLELLQELPGIFNLVLAAYERLAARGHLIEAAASEALLHTYRSDNDTIGTWVRDHLAPNARSTLPLKTVYERFTSDQLSGGIKNAPTKTEFVRGLRRALKDYATACVGSDLKGYALVSEGSAGSAHF